MKFVDRKRYIIECNRGDGIERLLVRYHEDYDSFGPIQRGDRSNFVKMEQVLAVTEIWSLKLENFDSNLR